MTLTELRYIVSLAREKHFGRAAEKCHVAQPTLSVAVKKLEDELGVILFERGQSEVSVTPAGEPIVRQAERVLAEAARVKELADTSGDPLAGPCGSARSTPSAPISCRASCRSSRRVRRRCR